MKSLWFKLILIATLALSGNPLTSAQTPEQIYQKGLMKEDDEGATLTRKQPDLDRILAASSRGRSPANVFWGKEDTTTHHLINGELLILTGGTQPILQSVLQSLKITGISLIIGGILTILIIYLLIMLIILLRPSLSDKRMV